MNALLGIHRMWLLEWASFAYNSRLIRNPYKQ